MALYVQRALTTIKVKQTKDCSGACPAMIGNTIVPSMGTGSQINPDSSPHILFSCIGGMSIFEKAL